MLRINIIAVGKRHDSIFTEAITHYQTKIQSECKLSWDIIPSSDKEDEGKRIMHKAKGTRTLLLDESGDLYTSERMAKLLGGYRTSAQTDITIVIGGAYGVSKAVIARADAVVSLGKLTFPHQLVRVILLEQLYRSFSILRGSKYHHE